MAPRRTCRNEHKDTATCGRTVAVVHDVRFIGDIGEQGSAGRRSRWSCRVFPPGWRAGALGPRQFFEPKHSITSGRRALASGPVLGSFSSRPLPVFTFGRCAWHSLEGRRRRCRLLDVETGRRDAHLAGVAEILRGRPCRASFQGHQWSNIRTGAWPCRDQSPRGSCCRRRGFIRCLPTLVDPVKLTSRITSASDQRPS